MKRNPLAHWLGLTLAFLGLGKGPGSSFGARPSFPPKAKPDRYPNGYELAVECERRRGQMEFVSVVTEVDRNEKTVTLTSNQTLFGVPVWRPESYDDLSPMLSKDYDALAKALEPSDGSKA